MVDEYYQWKNVMMLFLAILAKANHSVIDTVDALSVWIILYRLGLNLNQKLSCSALIKRLF